ncbi:hypothetical protein NECAME_02853 [Necator americanus]|uniref:Uncharacterized protein n=1 Tax=Necator americanus TaxID=51031 RepID=W2T9J8_NECAM|nr:hypothetical protein NECAME_02853 [Necator americanus]ETN78705.1 hypothetical protein NECAME_02853 [Necator americanus]
MNEGTSRPHGGRRAFSVGVQKPMIGPRSIVCQRGQIQNANDWQREMGAHGVDSNDKNADAGEARTSNTVQNN